MRHLVFSALPHRRGPAHLARTRLGADRRTAAHDHDFPELFLVTAGEGEHHWNGRVLPLARGGAAFIRPADKHHYATGPGAPLEFINLALSPAWWARYAALHSPALDLPAAVPGRPAGHRRLDEETTSVVERALGAALRAPPDDLSALVGAVAALVGALLAAPGAGAGEKPGRGAPPEWLARLLRDLRDPALAARPIGFWQARAGRAPEHFARTARRHLGCTFTERLNRARIGHAQNALLRGEAKIAALALDAGFENLGYFYRTFARYAGCAPREWLARQASEAAVPL